MEVSNEIKEDIRKTQCELKNAIRVHQVWVTRLHDDESNTNIKTKVKEAEKEIISIGQTQKRVIDRLRRELELYQQRLKAHNKYVNAENDNRYVAQQLRDHQNKFKNKSRPVSLLKPSVLSEIHVKTENNNSGVKSPSNVSDSETDAKSNEKENTSYCDNDNREKYQSQRPYFATVNDSRNKLANALNKVKESLISGKVAHNEWRQRQQSDSDSSVGEPSPSPSPPPLPKPGETITQERFLRLIGLVTHSQRDLLEKKRNERRKRATTSTNRNEFIYENYDFVPKRKKYNQFPYLQSHSGPPQTRSAKLRKQQKQNDKSSHEGSPSGSPTENKSSWTNSKPSWTATLPAGLSVEPVYSPSNKCCHVCGESDVPSLLVWCAPCGVLMHTGCGDRGRCGGCDAVLPDPANNVTAHTQIFRDKMNERSRLQQRNLQLCAQLQRLEARAAALREGLDEGQAERRRLLAAQISTQRNLQRLLDFIGRFRDGAHDNGDTDCADGDGPDTDVAADR